MNNDLLYQVALTMVPNIGDVHAKALINIYGNAYDIFNAPKKQLENIDGIGTVRMGSIKSFNDFKRCEEELLFIEKYKIQPLFLTNASYPKRLINCYDSPASLYYRGTTDLNHDKMISVVGTRNYTTYGKQITEEFINALKEENIVIISGLAFGIDTIAHKASVKHAIPTVGVLAHGLDRMYPPQNKPLAKQMTAHGGLLTEFKSNTDPDRENFPKRNRIVAGMCDCVVVVETGKKGGSLITAELANGYNKDVFAFPGRITDNKSEGCNLLIQNNKAAVITSASDLLQFMGWNNTKPVLPKQRELFIELTINERIITDLLNLSGSLSIDEIYQKSNLPGSAVASALLTLEMQSVIEVLPGKIYRMI